jgi:CDP-paratose 2-epimerase
MNKDILITGGAGFIGTNLADHYLSAGLQVTIVDNFSRIGSRENARWLREKHRDRVQIIENDVRHNFDTMLKLADAADVVFHQAGQVAVTSSVTDPRSDFEINALGTFNVLETIRLSDRRPMLLYSSTNKVYGGMEGVKVEERRGRYEYVDRPEGIPETQPLDFHSPYGCSKGCGDQYVVDYSRIYGLHTVVCRQSCIYGPHQFGIEDQGWVAWFAIRALQGKPVTIYGDGMQVRDVLFVEDLISAYEGAIDAIETTSGNAYNIGGGPEFTLSLLELVAVLEELLGVRLKASFEDWRPGDQRIYVSDIGKAKRDFGWMPRVDVETGVRRLVSWLEHDRRALKV